MTKRALPSSIKRAILFQFSPESAKQIVMLMLSFIVVLIVLLVEANREEGSELEWPLLILEIAIVVMLVLMNPIRNMARLKTVESGRLANVSLLNQGVEGSGNSRQQGSKRWAVIKESGENGKHIKVFREVKTTGRKSLKAFIRDDGRDKKGVLMVDLPQSCQTYFAGLKSEKPPRKSK